MNNCDMCEAMEGDYADLTRDFEKLLTFVKKLIDVHPSDTRVCSTVRAEARELIKEIGEER